MSKKTLISYTLVAFFLFLGFSATFMRSYLRTQSTLIGYSLGELKGRESELLEERSRLRMKLASLTTKKQLLKTASGSLRSLRDSYAKHF